MATGLTEKDIVYMWYKGSPKYANKVVQDNPTPWNLVTIQINASSRTEILVTGFGCPVQCQGTKTQIMNYKTRRSNHLSIKK